jgi:MFS family permease
MVYALVLAQGTVNAIDNPARQTFVMELVGRDRVVNAVSLNSLIVHSSRIIGPALAGVVIASLGIAPCFLVNAVSFAAMLIALQRIDPQQLHRTEPTRRARGQLRAGFRHVRSTPGLLIPLATMALVGTLSFNFQVLLPLMARFAFHGTATTYAALTTAMAAGAVVGALGVGARRSIEPSLLALAALAFGTFILAAAAAPSLTAELVVLAATGFTSVTFAASVNSTLQLNAAPAMRGRVMSLYSVVFLGSTPIGAPIAGWLAGAAGPRSGLLMGGLAALVGGVALWLTLVRNSGHQPSVQLQHPANQLQAADEPLHVLPVAVHRERRPRRRSYAQLAHQRLRAVMPGADAHPLPSEDLPDVVRMSTLQRERDQGAAVAGGRRAVHHQARDL